MENVIHYACAKTGHYLGKVEGAVVVTSVPADPEVDIWTGASWRKPMLYWAQDGGPFIAQDEVSPEPGAIGVATPPDGDNWHHFRLVEGAWVHDPDLALDIARAEAVLAKGDFCKALVAAQILTEDDFSTAIQGGWPPSFAAALDGMEIGPRLDAKAEWATATHVSCTSPLLAALAGFAELTPAQIDALFGI